MLSQGSVYYKEKEFPPQASTTVEEKNSLLTGRNLKENWIVGGQPSILSGYVQKREMGVRRQEKLYILY